MPLEYPPLLEGDALTAASLNARFAVAETWANDVGSGDFRRETFRHNHLPSLVTGSGQFGVLSATGPYATVDEEYESTLLPYSPNYQVFGTQGANPPYGPPGVADEGWRIIAQGGLTATAARVVFPAATALNGYKGLRVRLGVELVAGDVDFPPQEPIEDDFVRMYQACAIIGIGFHDGLGVPYCIPRSVRWCNLTACVKGDICTSTFITPTDLVSLGNGQVTSVFGVLAGRVRADPSQLDPIKVTIGRYNIGVMPIRAGDLA